MLEKTNVFSRNLNLQLRPNAGPGIWLMFLIPEAIILSLIKHPLEASLAYHQAGYLAVGFIITSALFMYKCKNEDLINLKFLLLTGVALGFTCYTHSRKDLVYCLSSSIVSTVGFYKIYLLVLEKFPQCFTLGEAAIFSQSFITWLYFTVVSLIRSCFVPPRTNMEKSTLIIQIGLLGVGTIAFLAYKFNIKKPTKFYLTTIFVVVFQILIPLHIIFKQSAILWIFSLIIEDLQLLKLFCYWTICVCGAILAITKQIKGAQKASTSTRKIFHILAVATYVPGLLYNCSFLYLASGVILGVFLFFEIVRIANIPPLYEYLRDGLVVFGDEKDAGVLALTPIYLLVGCSLPIWIHPSPCDLTNSAGYNLLPLLSGLLSIGVGDTCASFVGSKYGRYLWAGSTKTVEGTLACFLSQILVVSALANFGLLYPLKTASYIKIGTAIFVTSVIEAKTDQIDNIVLPLVMYIILSV